MKIKITTIKNLDNSIKDVNERIKAFNERIKASNKRIKTIEKTIKAIKTTDEINDFTPIDKRKILDIKRILDIEDKQVEYIDI